MDDFVCPECGAVLVRGRHDFAAHAFSHWGVGPRHIDRIPNSEAQKRYRAILDAESVPIVETGAVEAGTGKIEVIEGDL